MKKYILTLAIFSLFLGKIQAQTQDKNWSLDGYFTVMPSVMFEDIQEIWICDNLLHNRLNFYWYPAPSLTATLQVRNRFIYGDQLRISPGYAETIAADNGVLDLSHNIFEEQSFLLNTMLDRAWLAFEKGKLNIRVGRQRINWGQTFAWNPNDIFNTYSFFDFDYVEKPGSDAIRAQYYTGMASSVEAAIKWDKNNNITAAGLVRLNHWGYDFQLLGGILNSRDYVAGLGWSGNIKGAAFRGEMTYLHPKDNFNDTTGMFLASVGADYSFANSLMLQFEMLYSKMPDGTGGSSFYEYFGETLSVKNLAFSEWNLFGQASYPVTPLLNTSFSGMYFPEMKGFYIGPTIEYSLTENIGLSFILQYFEGEMPDLQTQEVSRQSISLAFLRFKGNF